MQLISACTKSVSIQASYSHTATQFTSSLYFHKAGDVYGTWIENTGPISGQMLFKGSQLANIKVVFIS